MTLVSQGRPARTRSFWVDAKVDQQVYDLYTCPPNCIAEVTMMHVVNAGGNTSVYLYWNDVSESYTSNIVGGKNMQTGEYFTLSGATLVLEPGDKLQAKSDGATTPHVDVLCTVTETFSII